MITIECRERSNVQDITWIEQLASKRSNIGANQTIAVSSSGFSSGAREYAERVGIELRSINEISSAEINSWIEGLAVELVEWRIEEIKLRIQLNEDQKPLDLAPSNSLIESLGYNALILQSETDNPLTLKTLGQQVVESQRHMVPPMCIGVFSAKFPPNTYFAQAVGGRVCVREVELSIRISTTTERISIDRVLEYQGPTGPIVQVAQGATTLKGVPFSVEAFRQM